ncbi:GIY-YIG nuclease family protein [Patescibacteria group bacterium]|nr:GIY-YIG nuclease family protein [Patescibacteria group bacterium]MBU1473145.1 GIY-YIG nuclease family protein [Patescibacteria group bacterium]MBU2544538.1 GIY-YIG nuclease family protein [Patescibacteria group bacterium]
MYYVYAVYNQENNKIYIGQSKNFDERLKLHNSKEFKHSFTSRFSGKWKLIYKEELFTRKDALAREKQLKSYRGRLFVKKLIHSPVAQR